MSIVFGVDCRKTVKVSVLVFKADYSSGGITKLSLSDPRNPTNLPSLTLWLERSKSGVADSGVRSPRRERENPLTIWRGEAIENERTEQASRVSELANLVQTGFCRSSLLSLSLSCGGDFCSPEICEQIFYRPRVCVRASECGGINKRVVSPIANAINQPIPTPSWPIWRSGRMVDVPALLGLVLVTLSVTFVTTERWVGGYHLQSDRQLFLCLSQG